MSHQVYQQKRHLAITTFTTIATIIGSGILALPVSLYNVSVHIFLIIFTMTFLTQVAVICIFIELMQHDHLLYSTQTPSTYQSLNSSHPHVSLFSIAGNFLSHIILRIIFYLLTLVALVALLVSYGLAGPQAIFQFLHPSSLSSPPWLFFFFFSLIGSIAVLFFLEPLLPVFSSLTVVKGVLFVSVVVIVAILPTSARPYHLFSLFSHIDGLRNAAPTLLIGVVALGGLPNTLPITFNLLPARISSSQLRLYRCSVIVGLLFCYLLNIGWVFAVLQVVPRVAQEGEPSLAAAYEQGQISTVPLIATLERHQTITGGTLRRIEMIVEMFIIISTCVSFFVNAAGLKNFLDGIAEANLAKISTSQLNRRVLEWILYSASFGGVILLILGNPSGFIASMTHFTALSFIVQGGLLLIWMLYHIRKRDRGEIAEEMRYGTVQLMFLYCVPVFAFAFLVATVGPFLGVNIG